jgi:very-short-patch-repair endonuclease
MSAKSPSSGAARHLLPRGEKGGAVFAETSAEHSVSPSPLVGEGARRADEGVSKSHQTRLLGYARSMRHEPTEAERKLWLLLRDRRFVNFKFRRQVPIGPYIADFVCYSARLIVEADGSQHAESQRDMIRDAELARRGFYLLRLWNNDILARPIPVSDAVWAALQGAAR